MSSRTLIEVFGHILFSFTRGVTEHYNPQEPEYTAESFGYSPLERAGHEWYRHGDPNEECIYQEYSDRQATTLDFIRSSRINASLTDASLPEENEETQEDQQDEDRAMAWKRLRPSALRTVCKSMYNGALISLLTATIIGSVYLLISYLCDKTINNCEFLPKMSIPVNVQWMRLIWCNRLWFSIRFVFFMYLISFSPTSVNGGESKIDPGCLPRIFLGHNLSSGSTRPGNISFQAFDFAKTSTLCFVFYGCMLASLSSNESLPSATDKEREDGFVFTNDSSLRIYYNSCRCCEMYYLPTL